MTNNVTFEMHPACNGVSPVEPRRRSIIIVAEEDDSDASVDLIPGPANPRQRRQVGPSNMMDLSTTLNDSDRAWKGSGMLASRKDLNMPAEEFAEGCKLLQQAALGNQDAMETILKKRPDFVNFRDYDRRTALHVAASEGHLHICEFLVGRGANINRSDRWGGSPLDDAHRHRYQEVIMYLRSLGASTGSTNNLTNFITAAAEGDVDEVNLLITVGDVKLDEGDYDGRTALHLAAGEGHDVIVQVLCEAGANANTEDRWGGRPLDDADRSKHANCVKILKQFGATRGSRQGGMLGDSSGRRREVANLEVDFGELEMIDRIGQGSFGEIYKCRWRGTLVAAKCIKSARIRKEWLKSRALERIAKGEDVDAAIAEMDEADMKEEDKESALADFRQEISFLKSLRHPNIVLLLAYSATENLEVMISELMKCSLLDIFKAHIVHGSKIKKKDQIVYATHLAQGMLYLHTCKPLIIHRDLKPANLLIDHSGVLKVADFGLAKVRPDPKKGEEDTFLMTGETGSYRFMAPEVYKHQPYTEAVDVYSYAMILFYLLDGKAPWPYLNGLVAVRKASDEGDRPPLPRHWDQRLQSLVQECWDENPQVRPPFSKILQTLNEYSRKFCYKEDYRTAASIWKHSHSSLP
jgi:serine/threonine protein kinase